MNKIESSQNPARRPPGIMKVIENASMVAALIFLGWAAYDIIQNPPATPGPENLLHVPLILGVLSLITWSVTMLSREAEESGWRMARVSVVILIVVQATIVLVRWLF